MLHISFDFDESSKQILNLQVSTSNLINQPTEPPKPTQSTRKKKSSKDESIIILEENKLVLTQTFLDLIGAEYGDRIAVRFIEKNGVYSPIIAKSEAFADPESGNKLTKSLTISYKGKQHDDLAIYGTNFTYKETSPGSKICLLIGDKDPITPDDKVFKGNKDLEPYDDNTQEIDNNVVDTDNNSLNTLSKKTYIPELKKTTDLGLSEDDYNTLDIDMNEIDMSDDLDEFLKSIE